MKTENNKSVSTYCRYPEQKLPKVMRMVKMMFGVKLKSIVISAVFVSIASYALATPLSGINAYWDSVDDTSMDYTVTGGIAGSEYPIAEYSINFNQGASGQDNLMLNGVITGSGASEKSYLYDSYATSIHIRRTDNAEITGNYQQMFYQRQDHTGTTVNLAPSRCGDMETTLNCRIINRGTDNIFANSGGNEQNRNNIERVDFIYNNGYVINNPEHLDKAGFVIMERGGNDYCYISVVTAIDEYGNPTAYGDYIRIGEGAESHLQWGSTGADIATTVLRGDYGSDLSPSGDIDAQTISGVLVTMDDLGISAGEGFWGYSLFGGDMTPTYVSNTLGGDLVDWSSYNLTNTPYGTGGPGGLDLLAGGSIMYDSDYNPEDIMVPIIPEPTTLVLLGGTAAVVAIRRKRK